MKNNRIVKIMISLFILDFIILNIIGMLIYKYVELCSTEPIIPNAVISGKEEYNIEEVEEISNKNQQEAKKVKSNPNDWNLLLVNRNNKIPENYSVQLSTVENNHRVDSRIVEALNAMLQDGRNQGLNPIICSSYRTNNKQTQLYNNKVRQYQNLGYNIEKAKNLASYWVAIPGTSEHETGLALDIVSKSYQILDENQENTKEQKWLLENSYKYGFILRYPKDKQDITMTNYEPWHYRYVGVENSTYIKENNLCLEEFIEYLKEN